MGLDPEWEFGVGRIRYIGLVESGFRGSLRRAGNCSRIVCVVTSGCGSHFCTFPLVVRQYI